MSFIKFVKKPNLKNVSNMSTPLILTTLILVSLIVIYTIESIGLSNRQRNIELRQSLVDSNILVKVAKARTQDLNEEIPHKFNIGMNKDDNVDIMRKMLFDAAINQMETNVIDQDYIFYDL
jgi:hypothetical protein